MKQFIIFLAGVVAGVAGVTLYYIYGKPTLPKENYKKHDYRRARGAIPWKPDGISTDKILRMSRGDYDNFPTIPDPNSLDDMGITQEIVVNPEFNPMFRRFNSDESIAATLAAWAKESE